MIRGRTLAGAVAALALGLPAGAHAATTQIGAVSEIDAGIPPAPETVNGVVVQTATAVGGNSYAVPPGYGVITKLRHQTGTNSANVRFKVYRPTGTPNEYTVVGSETFPVTAGAAHSFDVRIPVAPGDVLGLTSVSGAQLAYDTEPTGDQVRNFPGDFPVGSTVTSGDDGPDGYRLAVAAVVETDADGDGYGDDSQEAQTQIDSGPKKKLKTKRKRAKVQFAFSSPTPGATFECSIDGGEFSACASPYKRKLRKGKHEFRVRATVPGAGPDATPASQKFKIKRKRNKR